MLQQLRARRERRAATRRFRRECPHPLEDRDPEIWDRQAERTGYPLQTCRRCEQQISG